METRGKKRKYWGLLLLLMLFAAGFTTHATAKEVQAATNGFKTVSGTTYYYKNGKIQKTGLTYINGKYYYLHKSTGEVWKGWAKDSKGRYRFFDRKTGVMVTGWVVNSKDQYRYFSKTTGYMFQGWAKDSKGRYRYFNKSTGFMARGWVVNSKKQYRYFAKSTGYMAQGWVVNSKGQYRYFHKNTGFMGTGWGKNSKGYRYFYKGNGVMATGLVENSKGQHRFFNKSTGYMFQGLQKYGGYYYYFDENNGFRYEDGFLKVNGNTYYFNKNGRAQVGSLVIGNKEYTFATNGVLKSTTTVVETVETTAPTSARTIKNYLANALLPVGKTLYIYGGGHNTTDATRKGVSPKWSQWYSKNNSSYNYQNYMYQSTLGLDCSGYVGWSVYQVMQSRSNVGSGYTVTSGMIGSTYTGYKWGTNLTQSYLQSHNFKFYPGDIGYDGDHTWIVLGQCKDTSLVILHSTPNAGVQIAGTPTYNGNYSSQAISLAKQYMSRYKGYQTMGSSFYHTSTGHWIRRGNYFRWNRSTLSDPDGYLSMTADQILADLFK